MPKPKSVSRIVRELGQLVEADMPQGAASTLTTAMDKLSGLMGGLTEFYQADDIQEILAKADGLRQPGAASAQSVQEFVETLEAVAAELDKDGRADVAQEVREIGGEVAQSMGPEFSTPGQAMAEEGEDEDEDEDAEGDDESGEGDEPEDDMGDEPDGDEDGDEMGGRMGPSSMMGGSVQPGGTSGMPSAGPEGSATGNIRGGGESYGKGASFQGSEDQRNANGQSYRKTTSVPRQNVNQMPSEGGAPKMPAFGGGGMSPKKAAMAERREKLREGRFQRLNKLQRLI